MAQRTYKRLTVVRVKELAKLPGMHPDGDGLYLSVTKAGVASWIYRYMLGRGSAAWDWVRFGTSVWPKPVALPTTHAG